MVQTELTGEQRQTATWSEIDWTATEAVVKRLQGRIYRAAAAGNGRQVKNLQKLLVRSTSAKRLAVRRVAQQNAGRNTPGIDGVVCGTPESRMRLANDLSLKDYHPQPVRRVYIPKTDGRRRPLGIPTIRDRALQMLVKMALEPEWESCFEANSYGFRPGRCTMDAIVALHALLAPAGASEWVLDADISGCFDNIGHDPLLAKLPTFTTIIRRWLKAGTVELGTWSPTTAGTPQGGIATPRTQKITLPLNAHSTSIGVSRFLICVINSNTVMSHAAIDRHANGSPSERRVRVARSRPQRGGGHHDPVQRLRDFAPSGLPIRPAGPDPRRSACGYRTDNPGHREAARRHGTPSPGACRQQRPDSGRDRRARPRSVYRSGPGPCLTGPAAPSVSSTLSTACSAPSSNWSMRRWFRTGGGGLASQLM
jgi:retron-type reverse transcriptase